MIANGPDLTSAYWQFKLWFIDHTVARDALHIHLALILFFGSMLLFRWRLGDWRSWLVVLAAAMIGDGWDILDALARGRPVYWSSDLPDIWNTLFWPSAIMAMDRYTRPLWPKEAARTSVQQSSPNTI